MQTIIPILIFVLILGIVIFIHELGHFITARRAGVFVEEFALGMGPKMFSFKGKKASHDGEVTLFSLRVFPIGGFCRMRGMDDASDDPEALNNKSILRRASVMAGGSVMNFLLAFVLFFALIMVRGTPVGEILVIDVNEGAPGYEAGLRAGDVVTHVNDAEVTSRDNLLTMIAESDEFLEMRVRRGEASYNLAITPDTRPENPRVGFVFNMRVEYYPAGIGDGLAGAGEMILMQAGAPFMLISRLASGQPLGEGEAVMGPIGMGSWVTEAYQVTMERGIGDMIFTMVTFLAAINAALGVMNLLPIPGLDGARLVFLAIEGVRGRPVSPEREAMVHMVGLVSLLLLMVFVAYQDIARLIGNAYPG